MNQELREHLKEHLLELDPDIEFDKENDDKLIGYAERFGCSFIPLYDGINAFIYNGSDEVLGLIEGLNPNARKADGFEDTIIGYIKFEGETLILHDRDKMIEKMTSEYEQDPDLEEEEGYDYYTMAMEYYQYNVIGAYMDGVPAFACDTEDFPLPVTLDS
jgi:hypothetical protein